jgi:hypothetical protein
MTSCGILFADGACFLDHQKALESIAMQSA